MTQEKPKPVIATTATTPPSKPQLPQKTASPHVDMKSPVKSYIDPDQADNIGPQVTTILKKDRHRHGPKKIFCIGIVRLFNLVSIKP